MTYFVGGNCSFFGEHNKMKISENNEEYHLNVKYFYKEQVTEFVWWSIIIEHLLVEERNKNLASIGRNITGGNHSRSAQKSNTCWKEQG